MRSYINKDGLVIMMESDSYITLPLKDGECVLEAIPSERFMCMLNAAQLNGEIEMSCEVDGIHIKPIMAEILAA
jgi:hypothetical protein